MPIINMSVGVLSLSLLPYNRYYYDRLHFISLAGLFIIAFNLFYNRYVLIKFNDNSLRLFVMFSIFINFSIIPSLLFYIQFNFISYKFLNYFLLLFFPICSAYALINGAIKRKDVLYNNLLVILLYIFTMITSDKNVVNFMPAILLTLVSLLMIWENIKKAALKYIKNNGL